MSEHEQDREAVGPRLDRGVVPLVPQRDDWTAHEGGACPLPPGARFDSLHRDGSVTRNRLVYQLDRWDHLGTDCDIVAYRRVDKVAPVSLLPAERECCGTFVGSQHRATCAHHKRHNGAGEAPEGSLRPAG